MKNLIYSVLFIICTYSLYAQATLPISDFESNETTPYLFRYGNKGNQDMNSYKPRWVYAHEVVDNPFSNGNNSSKVLRYMSMEARDYGLKFRFAAPLTVDEVMSISFKIYQPANIIGKSVDTQYNSGQNPASKQTIAVKLLADYNAVCDFRSEDGIILTAQGFITENEWVTYKFIFDKNSYTSSAINKLKNGIKGIAILPTYGSGVTLAESNPYVCFIDDININETPSGIFSSTETAHTIYYADGHLFISELKSPANIYIYDLSGILVKELSCAQMNDRIPLQLERNKFYIVKIQTGREYTGGQCIFIN